MLRHSTFADHRPVSPGSTLSSKHLLNILAPFFYELRAQSSRIGADPTRPYSHQHHGVDTTKYGTKSE